MKPTELVRIQTYMRKIFGSKNISLRARPKISDSAEVYAGDEFVGVISVDEEDGELTYQFNMAILETDLDEA
jgi:Protein of unknown function (DUF3126)